MKQLLAVLVVLALCAPGFAMKKVNGREIPEKEDFSSYGASFQQQIDQYDTLLSEIADLLSTTEGSDMVNVDTVTATKANITTADITVPRESSSRILPIRAEKLTIGVPGDAACTIASELVS